MVVHRIPPAFRAELRGLRGHTAHLGSVARPEKLQPVAKVDPSWRGAVAAPNLCLSGVFESPRKGVRVALI
jgi:hypothetical protein